MFTEKDLAQIDAHGLTLQQVERQIKYFRSGFPYLHIDRAAVAGDGIRTFTPDKVAEYIKKILHKEAFDRAGLIYGIGHAVYSVSDPRALIFKSFVKSLSDEKGLDREYRLYSLVENLAPQIIANERKMYKGVSINVDFYSGFVYDMLGLPHELFTPLFAIARIAGWSAHRIEELINAGKIIRPAYMSVSPQRDYIKMSDR